MTEAAPSGDSDCPANFGAAGLFGAEPIDALGTALQRSRENKGYCLWRGSLILLACLVLSPGTLWAGSDDGVNAISGVVRDKQGVAQMGILVELIAPGLGAVASTFTDEHGRYLIGKLAAGHYRLRASGVLFAPVSRSSIEVNRSAKSIVNLTMAALFDTASWLPTNKRAVDEPSDNWVWTLRSSANRPILHLQDEEDPSEPETPNQPETVLHDNTHIHVDFAAGSSEVGRGGASQTITVARETSGKPLRTIYLQTGDRLDAPVQVAIAQEKRAVLGGGTRTLLTYFSNPDITLSDRDQGLQTLRLTNAQQGSLGEIVRFEVGGTLEGVREGSITSYSAHPFLRLTASPKGTWRLQYRLTTERDMAEYADVQVVKDGPPLGKAERTMWFMDGDGEKSHSESGRHQEISAAHDLEQGKIEVAFYHDVQESVLLYGSSAGAGLPSVKGLITSGHNGGFATLVKGKTTEGARISYVSPVRNDIWFVAEYAVGDAQNSPGEALKDVDHALREVKSHNSQTALIAIRGKIHASGTQVRASYRWQPIGDVSAVDPYSAMSDQAFLSLFARQQLHAGSWLPSGFEATLDISNLLAEGYRPFVSVDGRTLYLAQTPRSVQVGLAFNF